MSKDHKKSAREPVAPALPAGVVVDLIPVAKARADETGSADAGALDLIDQAADLLRASEQRAAQAQEKAEKVSARAIGAVRAAHVRIEQMQAQARLIEQHAAEQARLAEERAASAEALAQERISQAQAWAEEAEARARAAEGQLRDAQNRAGEAEERLSHLTDALRRKLSIDPAAAFRHARSLN
jgi:hypothetical protein